MLGACEAVAMFSHSFGVPGLGPPGSSSQPHSCPCRLPCDLPFLKPRSSSFPHHMSMLVVCVVVPSSSSGARYLPRESPNSCQALPLLQPGPPQGTADVRQPTHRPPAFLGVRDGLDGSSDNTGSIASDSCLRWMAGSWVRWRPMRGRQQCPRHGSPVSPFYRWG